MSNLTDRLYPRCFCADCGAEQTYMQGGPCDICGCFTRMDHKPELRVTGRLKREDFKVPSREEYLARLKKELSGGEDPTGEW